MNKKGLIRVFKDMSILLQIAGENPFKARAYTKAIEIFEKFDGDLESAALSGELGEISGIGKAIVNKTIEFFQTGQIEFYEKLKKEYPESLVEISKIAGLGIKRTRQLFIELEIKNISDLESKCISGEISKLKGFNKNFQEAILNSIEHKRASSGRYLQQQFLEEVDKIINNLKLESEINKIELTGSARRFSEIINQIEILISTENPELIKNILINRFGANFDKNIFELNIFSNFKISIEISNNSEFFWKLFRKTGSDEFLHEIDLLINNKILIPEKSEKLISKNFSSEEEIFELLDLQYIQPELRENNFFISAASENRIPDLIESSDLQGLLHIHSNWSDGRSSIREMVSEAIRLGFAYVSICDHSKSSSYAGGMSIEKAEQQLLEIDKLNQENSGIKFLKGIECDILSDGSLDYPDELLQRYDLVIVSIHSDFKMNRKDMTDRIIKALENKNSHILGHPTGRLIQSRSALELDLDEIFKAASDNNKILEINSNPYRLDLDWQNCIKAKELGIKFSINPDSHKFTTIKDIYLGVKVARKAGLSKSDIINTLTYDEILEYLK